MSKKKTETQPERPDCFGVNETPEGFIANLDLCEGCDVGGECEAELASKQAPPEDKPDCYENPGFSTDEPCTSCPVRPECEAATLARAEDDKPAVKNRFNMELRVELTPDEKREMASRAMQGIGKLRDMREDKKAVVKGWDSRIADLEGEVQKLSEKHERGWDIRPVACAEFHDYFTGRARVVRSDTGEVVKERLLDQSEMQHKLPIEIEKGDLPGIPIEHGGNPHPEESEGMVKIEES